MSLATFFPSSPLTLFFVLALIAWFVTWVFRLRSEMLRLKSMHADLDGLDQCVEPLRTHLLWRDRLRLTGKDALADPGRFFDQSVEAGFKLRNAAVPSEPLRNHLKTIFVAGCEESQLESSELTSQTLEQVSRPFEQLRIELLVMLLFGVLGTLVAFSSNSALQFESARAFRIALPPTIWAVLLALAASVLFLRSKATSLAPCLSEIRRKTTSVWILKLYPTVAQRAAQWAVQTLQNAARVTDASEVIDKSASSFVASIADAKQAGELFAHAMGQFSHGIEASDQALIRAQSKLAAEVDKFAESLRRWTAFEDEIRRFYGSVEAHQKQLAGEQKTLEYMLSTYRDFVRQATSSLDQSALTLSTAAGLLPSAFQTSAERVTQSTAEFQTSVSALISDLASKLETTQKESLAELRSQLETTLAPILAMENRLRALGEPFERAAHHLTEIATNLWRLNESFSREVTHRLSSEDAGR